MRTILGLLFIIVSFFGIIFFKYYRGSVIPYPILWNIPFIILGILGAWLIYSAAKKVKKIVDHHINYEVEKFKANAEKIELDFDKCEFKSGSFSHKVEDPTMNTVKLFAPGSLALIVDTTITENVIQSYLTYTDSFKGEPCKFVSQYFPFDPSMLKFHVLKHHIILYIDRFDKRKYLFDLKVDPAKSSSLI